MASRPQKPAVIDGLTSVRAARRARSSAGDAEPQKTDGPSPDTPPQESAEAAHFRQTAKPKRFDICCYHCGYEFPLHGRLRSTPCPKCREELSAEEVVIDAERNRDIRTIGTIELAGNGKLTDCTVVANHFVLAGNAKAARRIECNTLTIMHGARYEIRNISARDIEIHEDAHVRFSRRVECRDIEIRGQLKGKVAAKRDVRIAAGALFTGKLEAHSLTIEEGGSLSAELDLRPAKGDRT
jgi:cytoskeletal protein CcmA (bactofilin family)